MSRLAVDEHRVAVRDALGNRSAWVELLALLIEIGDFKARAAANLPLVWLELADQQTQRRRLARPVRTDEADAIAADDARREIANDRGPAKTAGDALRLEHHPAGGVRLLDLHPDGAGRRAVRRALRAQRHQRVHAPFVTRPPRLDAAAQPRLLLGKLLVQPLEIALFDFQRLGLLLEVGAVASRPRREGSAIELDNPGRQPPQERAIVRHEQQRAAEVTQVILEPLDGGDVEMVG